MEQKITNVRVHNATGNLSLQEIILGHARQNPSLARKKKGLEGNYFGLPKRPCIERPKVNTIKDYVLKRKVIIVPNAENPNP